MGVSNEQQRAVVAAVVRQVAHGQRQADRVQLWARVLERQVQPHEVLEMVLADVVSDLVDDTRAGGWSPDDLTQLVRRNAGERHLPILTTIVADRPVPLTTTDRVASALAVAALLSTVPLLAAGSAAAGRDQHPTIDHPKLARVRALLAKAESTEFDEEAEALTAKAQELISRYALGRLVDAARPGAPAGSDPAIRRVWLDAPYVRQKAALVSAVAEANRCRAAAAERFGFSIVVGDAADLEAVELLVTSLLVQADSAMLRLGRRRDGSGASRTRSFRSSFLFAYATRIRERLSAATAEAVAADGGGDLLPVLRDHETRVREAFDTMVPHTAGRGARIANGEGWYAGLAAADLAQLNVRGMVTDRTG